MQPLVISTSFSSVRERLAPPSRTSAASMLTSLMSLTITATRRPSRLVENVVEQRGLAGAEKAGQDGDGQAVRGSGCVRHGDLFF
jgi:hypothetical protein